MEALFLISWRRGYPLMSTFSLLVSKYVSHYYHFQLNVADWENPLLERGENSHSMNNAMSYSLIYHTTASSNNASTQSQVHQDPDKDAGKGICSGLYPKLRLIWLSMSKANSDSEEQAGKNVYYVYT
jgi:hypothetical protein